MTDSKKSANDGRFIWRESMTQNADKTQKFYGALFGWTFDTGATGGEYIHIKNAGKPIGGVMQMPKDKSHVPTHWESYVKVRDVDACIAAAQKLGGKAHWGPMDVPNVGRMSGILSFDGAALSIMAPSQPDQPRDSERPPVGTFCWETLTTGDVDRSKTFWTTVLGWTTSSGAGQPTFAVGEGPTNMVADIQTAQGGVPPNWLTFVVVAELEASCAKAAELGGKVVMPATPIPNMGRMAVITDDQGSAIGLFESL